MSTAIQAIILIIREMAGDDAGIHTSINSLEAELASDESKQLVDEGAIADLRAEVAALPAPFDATALEARVAALEGSAGSGVPVDLGPLTDRVTALETRNATDDAAAAAAGGPAPDQPPVSNLSLSPATLPDPVVGQPYTASIAAGGSTALPFAFSIAAGALPDGLTLGAGGGISGTPTVVGSFPVTIQAHDTNNDVGSIDYTLVVGDVAAAPEPAAEEPAPEPVAET